MNVPAQTRQSLESEPLAPANANPSVLSLAMRHPSILAGGILLVIMIAIAIAGPLFTTDPVALNPINRLKAPSSLVWFGTDYLGRDVFARVIYGARVSLVIGLAVAVIAVSIGLFMGLIAGYIRPLDAIIMRVMDGLMAIPAILLAIAMISLSGATLSTVVLAIVIPEIPRVVRLVRAIVLTVREEPYVEAAIASGTRPVADRRTFSGRARPLSASIFGRAETTDLHCPGARHGTASADRRRVRIGAGRIGSGPGAGTVERCPRTV